MTELPGGPEFTESPEESNFVKAAAIEVNKLIKANKINRRVMWGLAVISVISVLLIYGLHRGDVATCQAGNSYRTGQTAIWHDFISLLINRKTPPTTLKIANGFLTNDVGRVDALRNCGGLWP